MFCVHGGRFCNLRRHICWAMKTWCFAWHKHTFSKRQKLVFTDRIIAQLHIFKIHLLNSNTPVSKSLVFWSVLVLVWVFFCDVNTFSTSHVETSCDSHDQRRTKLKVVGESHAFFSRLILIASIFLMEAQHLQNSVFSTLVERWLL